VKARINDRARGVWSAEIGTAVEVVGRSANGRATQVRMPRGARGLERYAGKRCWLPTLWLDAYLPRKDAPQGAKEAPCGAGEETS